MCSANAAGNRSGAAVTRTSGNSTWTEHLTNPDIAVTANTNQSEPDVTKAENNSKINIEIDSLIKNRVFSTGNRYGRYFYPNRQQRTNRTINITYTINGHH